MRLVHRAFACVAALLVACSSSNATLLDSGVPLDDVDLPDAPDVPATPDVVDAPDVRDAASLDAADVRDGSALDAADVRDASPLDAADVRDASPLDARDGGCTASSQCAATPATPVCDRAAGSCVACTLTEDRCPAGQYCAAAGRCAAGCRDDAACAVDGGTALRCDLTTRRCVACRADTDCPAGRVCDASRACVPGCSATQACPTGQGCCAGTCLATNTDAMNCGACGRVCTAAHGVPACTAGRCAVARCDTGFADCDGSPTNGCEVDTRTTVGQCGACGTACTAGPFATATCAAGRCGITCAAGHADCDGDAANGCEVDTATNPDHCGACPTRCATAPHATSVCRAGVCGSICETGWGECDGRADTVCETSLVSAAHCGTCAVSCSGATPLCADQGGRVACVSGCTASQTRCGAGCADTAVDPANCGACDRACSAPANSASTCASGACGYACTAGFGDCDHVPANGCETPLTRDVANCGACGSRCAARPHATNACVDGRCAIGACDAGFVDCDGDATNGCETDTRADTANCGRCRNACSTSNIPTPTCASGVCGGACAAGFGDCDGDPRNGCETSLTRDAMNCGACANACASGVCGTTVSLTTDAAGWSLNGAARFDATGRTLVLTEASANQTATAFYRNAVVVDVFDATFEFRISGGTRADGMAFALQRTGATAVGRGGGGFGVAGLDGYAVELDDYNNFICADANGNHVGLDTLDVCDGAQGLPRSVAVSGDLPFDIVDGVWRRCDVHFDRGVVTVSIAGRMFLDRVTAPGWVGGRAYWIGFGGATGDLTARHEVRNVTVIAPTYRCL